MEKIQEQKSRQSRQESEEQRQLKKEQIGIDLQIAQKLIRQKQQVDKKIIQPEDPDGRIFLAKSRLERFKPTGIIFANEHFQIGDYVGNGETAIIFRLAPIGDERKFQDKLVVKFFDSRLFSHNPEGAIAANSEQKAWEKMVPGEYENSGRRILQAQPYNPWGEQKNMTEQHPFVSEIDKTDGNFYSYLIIPEIDFTQAVNGDEIINSIQKDEHGWGEYERMICSVYGRITDALYSIFGANFPGDPQTGNLTYLPDGHCVYLDLSNGSMRQDQLTEEGYGFQYYLFTIARRFSTKLMALLPTEQQDTLNYFLNGDSVQCFRPFTFEDTVMKETFQDNAKKVASYFETNERLPEKAKLFLAKLWRFEYQDAPELRKELLEL